MIIHHDDTVNNKCVIRKISTFYSVRARMCMCGTGSSILLAFVHAREVGVSSRNLVSRTFPQFYQSMLTPMSDSSVENDNAAGILYTRKCVWQVKAVWFETSTQNTC